MTEEQGQLQAEALVHTVQHGIAIGFRHTGTVMSRLHRARKSLLARMNKAPPAIAAERGNMRLVE